jgi:hypothetical protein
MERIIALLIVFAILFVSCDKEEGSKTPPLINFKQGEYTKDGDYIPVGGKLTFGIAASGSGAPITNFRVQRIINGVSITELDKGLFITEGGLDFDVNSVKSGAQEELWRFMVMNANRDSAVITLTIFLGEGSAYGPIKHFPSIKVGMQNNTEYPQFLDLRTGTLYTSQTVTGNENAIDLLGFVYYTGGVMSPTLSCPQYSSVPGHYPMVTSWPVRRSTLYDYNSVDNNLVNLQQFEAAANDSLLVASYRPQNVSGLCKFCFTGKIVPFKTEEGKFGLIRVIHADEVPEGYMELEVKVQE